MRFLATAATAALLACLGGAAADTACPNFYTKASIRKTVNGGKTATLTVRVKNNGADPVTNAGLGLELPNGATVRSVSVSPKLASVPAMQEEGNMVGWEGIPIAARKTRTFRIKLAFDQCAGGDAVAPKHANGKATGLYDGTIGLATFTGPLDNQLCIASKTVATNVRRPKTATECAPDAECSLPTDITTGSPSLPVYKCKSASYFCGPANGDNQGGNPVTTPQDCANFCQLNNPANVAFTFQQSTNYCECFGTTGVSSLGTDSLYQSYAIGAVLDPPVGASC